MTLVTTPFDPATHLTDEESQAEFLADAFASGEAAYIANALGIVARAQGLAATARTAGVTREALHKALSLQGNPRLSTLIGVTRALGYRLSVVDDRP